MLGILLAIVLSMVTVATVVTVNTYAAEAPLLNKPLPAPPDVKSAPAAPAAPAQPTAPQGLMPAEQKPTPLPEASYKDLLMSKGRILEKIDVIGLEAQSTMARANGMIQNLMALVKQHDEEIEKRDKAGTGNIEPKMKSVK